MATGSTQPFRPAGTVTLAATTTSAAGILVGGGSAVLVYNATAATAFFRLGAAAGMTALTSDTPIPPNSRMLVDGGPFITTAAVVLAAGSGNVYFTLGDGDVY